MRTTEIGTPPAETNAGPMHVDFLRWPVLGPCRAAIADKIGRCAYPQKWKIHIAAEGAMLAVQLIGIEERGQLIGVEPKFSVFHCSKYPPRFWKCTLQRI